MYFIYSYQQLQIIANLLEVSHGFAGIRHLMLVMFQIMLFQMYLWLLLWIYVMILRRELKISFHYLKLLLLLVPILVISMM